MTRDQNGGFRLVVPSSTQLVCELVQDRTMFSAWLVNSRETAILRENPLKVKTQSAGTVAVGASQFLAGSPWVE